MNLRWNISLRRFEAEFSQDFNGDLAAVKEAGFKTDGAPTWIWHASKAGPLTKLRTLRAGLLTISPEARSEYVSLAAMEEKNAKIKAEVAKHNKAQKKKQAVAMQMANAIVMPEKGYIDASDLPPLPPSCHEHIPPPSPPSPDSDPDDPNLKCLNCGVPVYFYEMLEPYPLCLWCEKSDWIY